MAMFDASPTTCFSYPSVIRGYHKYKAILSKNTPGVKKGEAKSEAPKVILFIYSTKKIDIM